MSVSQANQIAGVASGYMREGDVMAEHGMPLGPQVTATVLPFIPHHRLVPVVVIDDRSTADALGEALMAGGLPVAEVTLRTPDALAALEQLARYSSLTVGAGTVVTAAQVDQAVDAGATFIVSPGVSAAVIRRGRERGVAVVPGVATATEIMAALDEGVDVVKLFPAHVLGGIPALLALAAPFPQVRFIPTGGVDAGNVVDYLALPAVLAAGGSWMVPRAAVAAGDAAALTRSVAAAVALIGVPA